MTCLAQDWSRRGHPADRPGLSFDAYLETGRTRGIGWTVPRLEVLSLLWRRPEPWGPYDIAEAIQAEGPGRHPNTVYRVLRSLAGAGLIVPVRFGRRYLISPDPGCRDWGVFHCPCCDRLSLVPMAEQAARLRAAAAAFRFAAGEVRIECDAPCLACANERRGREPRGPR